jgi:hypothetical protein
MRQIQEALATTPVGASADFDEVPILSYYLVGEKGAWARNRIKRAITQTVTKARGISFRCNLSKQDELEAELLEDLEEEELEEECCPNHRRGYLLAPVEPSAEAASSPKQRGGLSELTKLQAEMAL